jgi:hypothetical protein
MESPNSSTSKTLLLGLILATGAVLSCGTDGGTGPDRLTIADFAGRWEGLQYAVVSSVDPNVRFDLIEDGGTVHMTVEPSGSFSGTVGIPGARIGMPEVELITFPVSGLWRLEGMDRIHIEFLPQIPPIFTIMDPFFELDGNRLTIWEETAEFDFDGNGEMAPANFVGIMVRP